MFYLYSYIIVPSKYSAKIFQKQWNYCQVQFALQPLKVQSAKPLQLAQNNCNLLWQILVALTKLLVGQNWHDPKWLYSDWEYLRSNWNFAVGFEHSQHPNIWPNDDLSWWNEFRQSDCFKIFAVSLIWRRPKCLIRLICVTACFTWSGSKLVLFPLALIQCWWFKMHKFLSRKVFIWLTKLHLSSGKTATCSEMVICSIFGSKMDTSFERS